LLITEEVEVELSSRNVTHYENKGYKIPRTKDSRHRLRIEKGTKINVKVEDLSVGSHNLINVKCDCEDCKSSILKPMEWRVYKRFIHEDGTYYCNKCAMKLFGGYTINNIKKRINIGKYKSFEQWCIENNELDTLDLFDMELNDETPSEITCHSSKTFWFKCDKGIHKSELKGINHFTSERRDKIVCIKCSSFAQWGIDNIGEDFLEKYWSDKNILNPWEITRRNEVKVWIICQSKNYHEDYDVSCANFVVGDRCPYCTHKSGKTHRRDSLGALYPESLKYWSNKNIKSPFEYTPKTEKKVWWKCLDGHEDYFREIAGSNRVDFRCPECTRERDESFLQEKVRLYLNELGYTILHENKCTIIPINPKTKHPLPFDNEIIVNDIHILCEVHGVQHYKLGGFHLLASRRNNTTPEYELHYQKLKDRYKKLIAYKRGYEYLEIPYWTNNDESYKILIDNKIKEIQKQYKRRFQ